MGHLDRYKKSGGFLQLLLLIESFAPQKQEKFLSLIESENVAWSQTLKEKLLTFERIIGWPPATVAEILPHLQPNIVGMMMHGLAEADRERVLSVLPAGEKRRILQEFEIQKPTPNEIAATKMKLIEKVRKLISEGGLRIEAIDASAIVDENTEKKVLNSFNGAGAGGHPFVVNTPPGMDSETAHDDPPLAMPEISVSSASDPKLAQELKSMQALVVSLQKENRTLKGEVKVLKDKLETIRKIA